MSRYKLSLHPSAKKEISKLDPKTRVYIVKSLENFIESYSIEYERELMRSSKIKKLKGEWKEFYRLRLRDYRVIYEKRSEELIIHIVRVAHRREVY